MCRVPTVVVGGQCGFYYAECGGNRLIRYAHFSPLGIAQTSLALPSLVEKIHNL